MESSLHSVWESAAGNPYVPTVGKGSQFFVGITLLVIGILLSGLFGLSMFSRSQFIKSFTNRSQDRSLLNVPLIGIPASAALAYVFSLQNTSK